MCFETAGSVRSNGSASSLTVAAPSTKRGRIARRVALDRAANVSLRRSSSIAFVTLSHTLVSLSDNKPIRKIHCRRKSFKRWVEEREEARALRLPHRSHVLLHVS